MSYQESLAGRTVTFKDGSKSVIPPLTYDEFVENCEWWGASDMEYQKWTRECGFFELDDYREDFLDDGFSVEPLCKDLRDFLDNKSTYYPDAKSLAYVFWGITNQIP